MNALMGNNKQSSGGGSGNLVGQLAGSLLGGGKQSHGSNSGGSGGGSGNLVGQLAGSLLGGGKQNHGSNSSNQQSSGSGHSSSGGLGGLLGSVMGGGSVRVVPCNVSYEHDRLTNDSTTSLPVTTDTATARPTHRAELTLELHRLHLTSQVGNLDNLDNMVEVQTTTATPPLHLDSMVVEHPNIKARVRVKAKAVTDRNTSTTSTEDPISSPKEIMVLRLGSVDKAGLVPMDTAKVMARAMVNKQAMADLLEPTALLLDKADTTADLVTMITSK